MFLNTNLLLSLKNGAPRAVTFSVSPGVTVLTDRLATLITTKITFFALFTRRKKAK